MSNRPDFFPAKNRAARSAPSANVARLAALWVISTRSPVPANNAVWSPTMSPPRTVAKLKPDMTRSQVRFILGTPLVADVFHPNRWDYVYLTGKAGEVRRQRKITVVFDGDRLKYIDGDVVATENLSRAPTETANP